MKSWAMVVTGVVTVLFPTGAVAAVVGVASQNPDGSYTYSYTVDNLVGSFPISAWSLEFDISRDQLDFDQIDVFSGGSIEVASDDWFARATPFPVVGASGQDFINLFGAPLAVGEMLGGFSFVSAYPPDSAVLYAEFSPEGESATASTVGPARPPELVIVGLASPTELSVVVNSIPSEMTFHFRSSTDLEEFVPLDPPVDIDADTVFPLAIPVELGTNPSLYFELFSGLSPAMP